MTLKKAQELTAKARCSNLGLKLIAELDSKIEEQATAGHDSFSFDLECYTDLSNKWLETAVAHLNTKGFVAKIIGRTIWICWNEYVVGLATRLQDPSEASQPSQPAPPESSGT